MPLTRAFLRLRSAGVALMPARYPRLDRGEGALRRLTLANLGEQLLELRLLMPTTSLGAARAAARIAPVSITSVARADARDRRMSWSTRAARPAAAIASPL